MAGAATWVTTPRAVVSRCEVWRRWPRGLLEAASLFGRLAGNAGGEYRGVNRGNAESGTVAVVGEAEVDRAGAPCSAAIRVIGAAVLKGEMRPEAAAA